MSLPVPQARGDVAYRAGPAHRLAARVTQAHADDVQPARASGRRDADDDVHARRSAREMRGHGGVVLRPILRMKRNAVHDVLAPRELEVGRKAADLEIARRRIEFVGLDIPVPMALARCLHGKRVALLREAQGLLRALALRDVAVDGVVPDRFSVENDRRTLDRHLDARAILAPALALDNEPLA